ncbi:MAG: hypothetical protein HY243_09840 [Proteobacteria bacterium]|nr:hypothetical protein [Pseudomonadota bacterium]
MIVRALFFLGIVAFLMPREPDLGFGRPGGISLPFNIMSWMQAGSTVSQGCKDRNADCGGIQTLDQLQTIALRGLAEVKAEIEADKRARKGHAG